MTDENMPGTSSDIIAHIDSVSDRMTNEMVKRLIDLDNGIQENKKLLNERIGLEIKILEEFVSMYERFLSSGLMESMDARTAEKASDYNRHFIRTLGNLNVLIETLSIGDVVDDSNSDRVEIDIVKRGPPESKIGEIFETRSPHSYKYNGKVFKPQKVSIYKG